MKSIEPSDTEALHKFQIIPLPEIYKRPELQLFKIPADVDFEYCFYPIFRTTADYSGIRDSNNHQISDTSGIRDSNNHQISDTSGIRDLSANTQCYAAICYAMMQFAML